MNISGYCKLMISGQGINNEEICENTTLQLKNIFRNDKVVHIKYGKLNYTETKDSLIYEIEFKSDQELDEVLNMFVSKIVKYKMYLQLMNKNHDVILWCSLYAYYAQFFFKLNPETMEKISDLGIGIDFSFYSEGQYKD